MRNWMELVPETVAIQQIAYERRIMVCKLRELGMSLSEIGVRLGVSTSRAQQMLAKENRRRARYGDDAKCPVERYFQSNACVSLSPKEVHLMKSAVKLLVRKTKA